MIKKSINIVTVFLSILTVTISCNNSEEILPKPPVIKHKPFFSESFEKSSPEQFINADTEKSSIEQGASSCNKAGIGTTKEHNSKKVDYKESQNNGRFLAFNPENCKTKSKATILLKEEFNITKVNNSRPLQLRLKYYQTSILNSGKSNIKITIKDEKNSWVIQSELDKKNQWTNLVLNFPANINNKITDIKIEMGGEEAVAIDDIIIDIL
ncbi:hypothetical protein [Tenacibaculum sp. C7A-26P2]|uniref:hypothetical protein n=1 Tax=Tenacibaculum sp. C7A-26P2 TaxID=3447504 RepID=UPI003F871F7C